MSCQCLIGIGEYGYVNAVICCRLIYYRLPKLLDYVTQRNTCIMTETCMPTRTLDGLGYMLHSIQLQCRCLHIMSDL